MGLKAAIFMAPKTERKGNYISGIQSEYMNLQQEQTPNYDYEESSLI